MSRCKDRRMRGDTIDLPQCSIDYVTEARKYILARPLKIVLNSRDSNISWAYIFVENTL